MENKALELQQVRFERMFSERKQMVVALARNLVLLSDIKDLIEPEDLVQETLLKAWNAFDTYDPIRSQFSSWLIVIMKSLFWSKLRVYKRRIGVVRVPVSENEIRLYENASSPALSMPDTQLVENELQESIAFALGKLSVEHRDAVIAMDIMGLTYEEAGALLNIDSGTVKSRLNRAHKILKKDPKLISLNSA
ncbi:MAG: RNA polymerase sigma factor [Patescibacteria group bacterium]